jgi:hypothetical protein
MALVRCLVCDCSPNFVFNTKATFSAHKKSLKHLAWERGQNSEKVEATRRDNEIYMLRLKLSDREETIERLCCEKRELNKIIEELVIKFETHAAIATAAIVRSAPKTKTVRPRVVRPSNLLARPCKID